MSDKVQISYDDYIVIHDDEITSSHLPENVSFCEDTLTFTLGAPVALHVIVLLSRDKTLKYQFDAHVHADVIETRVLHQEVTFNREVRVGKGAVINFFNENDSIANQETHFNDYASVDGEATVNVGYAELTDNNVSANYHYQLKETGANLKVRMAVVSQNKNRKKYVVNIEHQAPHTSGVMDNYGVAKDEAHLVIDGIGSINKGQRGSESHQTNKIMVFDPQCVASANPYLYIDEYDVSASHAAAVGKMDEEHLYYLQSRGLSKREAMQLITYGYLKPVIEVVDNEMLKERFEVVLSRVGEKNV